MDVKSTFLNSEIEELVYVEQPPSFKDPKHLHNIYELHKALYGLKKAPRERYECHKKFLLAKNFKTRKLIGLFSQK